MPEELVDRAAPPRRTGRPRGARLAAAAVASRRDRIQRSGSDSARGREVLRDALALELREREAGGVPELRREVARAGHPSALDRDRRSRGRRGGEREAHGVGAELLDRLERVDHVALGLRHLFAADAHETVQVHRARRAPSR